LQPIGNKLGDFDDLTWDGSVCPRTPAVATILDLNFTARPLTVLGFASTAVIWLGERKRLYQLNSST
jgi:hypothetical protein